MDQLKHRTFHQEYFTITSDDWIKGSIQNKGTNVLEDAFHILNLHNQQTFTALRWFQFITFFFTRAFDIFY